MHRQIAVLLLIFWGVFATENFFGGDSPQQYDDVQQHANKRKVLVEDDLIDVYKNDEDSELHKSFFEAEQSDRKLSTDQETDENCEPKLNNAKDLQSFLEFLETLNDERRETEDGSKLEVMQANFSSPERKALKPMKEADVQPEEKQDAAFVKNQTGSIQPLNMPLQIDSKVVCNIMKMATFTIKMANFTVNKYALAKTYSKAIAEVGQEFWNPKAIATLELLPVPESILLKLKVNDKRRANLLCRCWSTELVVEENRFGFRKTCGKNEVSIFWDQDENGSFPLAFNYKDKYYKLKSYDLSTSAKTSECCEVRLSITYEAPFESKFQIPEILTLVLKQKQPRTISKPRILLKNSKTEEKQAEMGEIELDSISHNFFKKIDISEFPNLLEKSTKIKCQDVKTILDSKPETENLELVLAKNLRQKKYLALSLGQLAVYLLDAVVFSAQGANVGGPLFIGLSILHYLFSLLIATYIDYFLTVRSIRK